MEIPAAKDSFPRLRMTHVESPDLKTILKLFREDRIVAPPLFIANNPDGRLKQFIRNGKLACLNAKGLRDQSKAVRLLRELLSPGVDLTAIQETHFICDVDARVQPSDFVVYSAYPLARGVIAVKSCSFRIVAVYVPNNQTDRDSFFRPLRIRRA